MMRTWAILLVAALLALQTAPVAFGDEAAAPYRGGPVPASNVAGKKLIRASEEIGSFWGAKSLAEADLPAKIAALQEAGYDGLVFSFASHDRSKGYHVMTGQWWNCAVRRTYEEFEPEVKAFQSVADWGRITNNFTRTMPAVWSDSANIKCQDWFSDEDWEVVLGNARVLAQVAKECGLAGIMLDTEQYAHHGRGPWRFPFNYKLYAESGYKLAGEETPRSYEECEAKVRERAREYGEAITGVYPDVVFFVIAGLYEVAWSNMVIRHPGGNIEESEEALYPAFVDGILAGLDERAKIVAGTESTYAQSQYKDMLMARDAALEQALCLSAEPEVARRRITFSAGIWTDSGWGPKRFSDTDVSANQRDPERHLHAVHNALAASDEYAWQWGEMGGWLSPNPTPLIGEYWKANLAGHAPQDLAWEPVPKWDMTDYSDYDRAAAEKDAAFWKEVDKGGWRVAADLPVHWHFFFDTEQLIRFGRQMELTYDESAWPLLSVLRCWQSQSVKANGAALYRVRFNAPADLDPEKQEIVLALGGFPPDDVERTGWMDVSLNRKGYPIRSLIDVSKSIRPGEENVLVVRVINKAGPGGLAGHMKLLVRGGGGTVESDRKGEVILREDFERYREGMSLSAAGWTMSGGDMKVTTKTGLGKGNKAIDGSTATA
ncbi:MAG: hypothetical protein V2A58_13765, partial [Planctomycetota bacterium]